MATLLASALTATELTNSPNQDFGFWKNEGNGGNGGKWRRMGGNGGGNGEIAGIAHGL